VASEENAKQILRSGCLLPRNAAPESPGDLSSPGVQARRSDTWLGDGNNRYQHKIHDCLNFFLNPINSTVDAFCRNQLVAHGLPLKMVMFEFPLRHLEHYFSRFTHHWAFSNRNIAKGGFASALPNHGPDRRRFDWKAIFEVHEKRSAHERAAEFLIWSEELHFTGLPVSLARRVLMCVGCPLFPPFKSTHFLHLKPTEKLLDADIRLRKFIKYGEGGDFRKVIQSFRKFEPPIPLNVNAFRVNELGASDLHGVPHVTRVMFWSHYLVSTPPLSNSWQATQDFLPRAMHCALLHDLERTSDREDQVHGRLASELFRADLMEAHPAEASAMCEAIEFHCRPDGECENPENPYFKVLKDADALDRGRFGWMCDGTDFRGGGCDPSHGCQHKGCAYKTLRLDYESVRHRNELWPFRKSLAMAACNVARATSSAPWELDNPFAFFSDWIAKGQKAVIQWQSLKEK